jgi:hypothetical protein
LRFALYALPVDLVKPAELVRDSFEGDTSMFTKKTARRSRPGAWLCGTVLILALNHPSHASDVDTRKACEALKSLSTNRFKVETAEWVNAGRLPVGGPAGAGVEAPEHCLFRVTIDPRPSGIEDMQYGTGIELRLPANWNGRLLFQGGGGLNGVLPPAVGAVTGFPSALTRGFAVVTTDSGHRGRSPLDARFGVDQQAKLDFAYQGVERTTREAKSLLTRFYGKQPQYSYYMGCSTGGREAMLAAQRLPIGDQPDSEKLSDSFAFHVIGTPCGSVGLFATVLSDKFNSVLAEAVAVQPDQVFATPFSVHER